MAKSSYNVKQGNIFGRIGTELGRGLAESIPKEVERNRLAKGIEELNSNPNLTPLQYFSQALTKPGLIDRPQAIQSLAQLAREQGMRKSYIDAYRGGNAPGSMPQNFNQGQSNIQDVRSANIPEETINKTGSQPSIPTGFESREQQAMSKPGLVEPETNPKFLPTKRWTPEQVYANKGMLAERFPLASDEDLNKMNADAEERYLGLPEDERKQQDYLRDVEFKAKDKFNKDLSTSLEKEGKEIYGDISGQLKLDAEKAMLNDLKTNPNLTTDMAAEKWVKKLHDFTRIKSQNKELAGRDIHTHLNANKKEDTIKSLMERQKIYADLGRQKEYFDMLRSDFGLSPERAAMIAYPRSESVKKIIRSTSRKDFSPIPSKTAAKSSKIAEEFGMNKTSNDSILGFMRSMKDNIPTFDESAFFEYLKDNQERFGFTGEQKEELGFKRFDLFPNWGDIFLFPYFGRSKVND